MSASDWHKAAVLSALISGRTDFAIADVQQLTCKGQTHHNLPAVCTLIKSTHRINPSLIWRFLALKFQFPRSADVQLPDQHPGSPYVRVEDLSSCSPLQVLTLPLPVSLCRDCIECKLFNSGRLADNQTCQKHCKDEIITTVDVLGK